MDIHNKTNEILSIPTRVERVEHIKNNMKRDDQYLFLLCPLLSVYTYVRQAIRELDLDFERMDRLYDLNDRCKADSIETKVLKMGITKINEMGVDQRARIYRMIFDEESDENVSAQVVETFQDYLFEFKEEIKIFVVNLRPNHLRTSISLNLRLFL